MKITSLWKPQFQVQPAPATWTTPGLQPANVSLTRFHKAVVHDRSMFQHGFRTPSVFRFVADQDDDVVIQTPWGRILPTEPKESDTPNPSIDITIEQRRRRQEEDDQRSWDNVLRIPLESPEDRARWIEEQQRRDDAGKDERKDERGVVIIDYKI